MADYKVPYQFIAGTRARAHQVNANFDYVADGLKNLDSNKANISGDPDQNFSVADPTNLQHAATKRYVDLAISKSGGSGSGVGKSVFEVFHTLSTKTPPGAFSLRTGALISDAENMYPAFWLALKSQGSGVIPDFSNLSEYPQGYSARFENIPEESQSLKIFAPHSWSTVNRVPSSTEPIVAELVFPDLITCEYFKINSHIFNTYDSMGDPDPKQAVKTASISVRLADNSWQSVAIINESIAPSTNERYYANMKPNLEFNAVRIVIAANFGASKTDVSIYPVDPNTTSVRVVSEEQWQWEISKYGETGAFVLNETEKTIRLPKITRFLSGVQDLWQVGIPEENQAGGTTLAYDDSQSSLIAQSSGSASVNAVSTGLWIQVYNAVSEAALSNVVNIPHGQLFEEQLFRFIPKEESGWYATGNIWRDGKYFESAFSLLQNQNAQAVTVQGKNYKLAPNGMKFVSAEVYESTYKQYGEVPFYVIDSANSRFKTPISNNYRRCTSSSDNIGDLILDGVPNITGAFGPVDDMSSSLLEGAIYNKGSRGYDASSQYSGGGWNLGFDASRCNPVYGRSDEVQVKSSTYIVCVFLGNFIPQASNVNVQLELKDCINKVEVISQSQAQIEAEFKSLKSDISSNSTEIEALQTRVSSNADAIAEIQTPMLNLESKIDANTQAIEEVKESINFLSVRIATLESKVQALEDNAQNITFAAQDGILKIDDNK